MSISASGATFIPKTKLWKQGDSYIIVLECECGGAVEYPGHPDDRAEVLCSDCHHVWAIKT